MKINILIIILLVAAGSALGYLFLENEKKINSDGYTASLNSINILKNTEAELDSLVLQSRYGLQSDYDELAAKSNVLNAAFVELSESGVANYESTAVDFKGLMEDYREKVLIKSELIENFKSHNAVLRNSIKYAPILGDELIAKLESGESDEARSSAKNLTSFNQALYRWALYSNNEQAEYINNNANVVFALSPLFEDEIPLIEYSTHVATVVQEQEQTQSYLQNALAIDTKSTLESLEDGLSSRYVELVNGANQLWTYALIYGLICLLAIIYLVYRLRQSYVGLENKVASRTQEINNAYDQLKNSQDQLVQSEKMASLGQMVAGVAHEINTPLGYAQNNMALINNFFGDIRPLMNNLGQAYKEAIKPIYDKKLINGLIIKALKGYRGLEKDDVLAEANTLLSDSNDGLTNISSLVDNLRDFSHVGKQSSEMFNVHKGLDSTLKIASNLLGNKNIEVQKDFGDISEIESYPSKLNQVFLNIISNAAQAIPEDGGVLKIKTEDADDHISIRFTDTGVGMDDEVKSKIFDPFYTNKPIGEGTGLGLSISYKIINDHHGKIKVDSAPGKGTSFELLLPKVQPEIEAQ